MLGLLLLDGGEDLWTFKIALNEHRVARTVQRYPVAGIVCRSATDGFGGIECF